MHHNCKFSVELHADLIVVIIVFIVLHVEFIVVIIVYTVLHHRSTCQLYSHKLGVFFHMNLIR